MKLAKERQRKHEISPESGEEQFLQVTKIRHSVTYMERDKFFFPVQKFRGRKSQVSVAVQGSQSRLLSDIG